MDNTKKNKFIELRAKGISYDKIAVQLKVSKQTLINWSKELQYEIDNLKAIELEALQEKYYITKEARIKLFGERVLAIKKELEKRNLSEVPTEKLIDLLLRHYNILQNEFSVVQFKQESENKELDELLKEMNLQMWSV